MKRHYHAVVLTLLIVTSASARWALVSAEPYEVGKLLGKSQADIQKVLGPAVKTGTSEGSGLPWCDYKLQGTEGIKVYYAARGGGLPQTMSVGFEVSFRKDIKWQEAAELIGIKPEKMKLTSPYPWMSQIVKDPYKNWNVYFAALNAHYPTTPGSPAQLVNSNGGLPMISFEGRELNDETID